MTSKLPNIICTLKHAGKLSRRIDLVPLTLKLAIPTALCVARAWTCSNQRVRQLGVTSRDFLPLALDQVISALRDGSGCVALATPSSELRSENKRDRISINDGCVDGPHVVAMFLSCSAVQLGGDENALVHLPVSCLSASGKKYKLLMDRLYKLLLRRVRKEMYGDVWKDRIHSLSYGLKGGVLPEFAGLRLLPLCAYVGLMMEIDHGKFTHRVGIATNHVTTSFSRASKHDEGWESLSLQSFVDHDGTMPYAGDDTATELYLFVSDLLSMQTEAERLFGEVSNESLHTVRERIAKLNLKITDEEYSILKEEAMSCLRSLPQSKL